MPDEFGSSEAGKKGGQARALRLSPSQRSEIAKKAAEARWDVPKAAYSGVLSLNDLELPCAVLEDGTRVLSQAGFLTGLGIKRGGVLAAASKGEDGSAPLPYFVGHRALRPFIPKGLWAVLASPVKYRPDHGGVAAHGIRADLIPQVCEVWLRAREGGALTLPSHQRIALQAEILMRALAHVGIVALVDEATGYQDARARDALVRILERFVADDLRKWVKTFPDAYYKELFRLRGWPYSENIVAKPGVVGTLTNDIVYDRLAPGVKDELKRRTPRDSRGRHKQKLHQRLTPDAGHPALTEHLGAVVAIMQLSDSWDEFKDKLNRIKPKHYGPLFTDPKAQSLPPVS
jgi:hypothetical protein